MAAGVPQEAFERWLRPAEALAGLPAEWGDRTKRHALIDRFSDGSIKLLARTCVLRDQGTQRRGLTFVQNDLWSDPWNVSVRHFWTLGDVVFDDSPPIQAVYVFSADDLTGRSRPVRTVTYRDVRVDPQDFEREFGPYLDRAASEDEGDGAPIARAEIERFARLYLDTWGQKATEMKALTAIRAAYPEHRIGRDMFLSKFRELRGPGKVGKPPKNNS